MAGKKRCSLCCQITTFLILAILFIGLGIGAIFLFKKLVKDNVNDQVALKNGTMSLDEWKSPTSPVYISYYVFDCQNPDDVVKHKKKPIVKQKGPYTYREGRLNKPTEWSNDGNVLTYETTKWYYFDEERSCVNCSDSDKITMINISPLSLVDKFENKGFLYTAGLDFLFGLASTKLYMTRTIHEAVFGYDDELLTFIKTAEDKVPSIIRNALNIKEINPKIALQYNGTAGRNSTGNITIDTGKDNPNNVMETLKWRGQTEANYWRTKYGGMLNGTDGTHFHPFVKKDDVLYTFITDLCRSLFLEYYNSLTVREVNLLRFTTTADLFANSSVNPDNAAFCVPRCFCSGILPIGQCLPNNPPIMMSAPHFFQGDPELVANITGMHPEREKHATYIDVEPYTGITMQAYKRLQINVYVPDGQHVSLTSNIREMIHPILFLQEYAQVSSDDAAKFRRMVYDKLTLAKGVQYGLIALGGLFVLILLVVVIRGRSSSKADGKVGLISGG